MKILAVRDGRQFFCFDQQDDTFITIDFQHFLSFPQDERDEVGYSWSPSSPSKNEVNKVYRQSAIVDTFLRVLANMAEKAIE
jgi:hypothetical protein